MGWGGSVLSMIQTLRNNRKMLRRKTPFKKNYAYFQNREAYLKTPNHELNFKSATPEQIEEVRAKTIQQESKQASIRTAVLAIVGTMVLFVFIGLLFYWQQQDILFANYEKQEKEKQEIVELKVQEKLFAQFIDDGDDWLTQSKWENAVHFYNLALEIFPTNIDAKHRLAIGYVYTCRYDNLNCEEARSLIGTLIETNPANKKFYELRANYYFAVKDSASAFADLDVIDRMRNEP